LVNEMSTRGRLLIETGRKGGKGNLIEGGGQVKTKKEGCCTYVLLNQKNKDGGETTKRKKR